MLLLICAIWFSEDAVHKHSPHLKLLLPVHEPRARILALDNLKSCSDCLAAEVLCGEEIAQSSLPPPVQIFPNPPIWSHPGTDIKAVSISEILFCHDVGVNHRCVHRQMVAGTVQKKESLKDTVMMCTALWAHLRCVMSYIPWSRMSSSAPGFIACMHTGRQASSDLVPC